jgi:hypothetical protein
MNRLNGFLVAAVMPAAVLFASAAVSAASAHSAAIQDCPAPPGAVKVALPSGLPPALRNKMGNIALPGEPFNTIDIYVKGQPNRRYIFVWNIGTRWLVATEIGGIALRAAISTYELGKDGKTAALIDERFTFPNDVCGAATKLAATIMYATNLPSLQG